MFGNLDITQISLPTAVIQLLCVLMAGIYRVNDGAGGQCVTDTFD